MAYPDDVDRLAFLPRLVVLGWGKLDVNVVRLCAGCERHGGCHGAKKKFSRSHNPENLVCVLVSHAIFCIASGNLRNIVFTICNVLLHIIINDK